MNLGEAAAGAVNMTLRFPAWQTNPKFIPSNPNTFTQFSFLSSPNFYPRKCTLLQLLSSDTCNYSPMPFHISTATFIILMVAEYCIALKQLNFLQLLKVHTQHAWFTLDPSGSEHFARDELSEEREPLGEKRRGSVASGASQAATLLGADWETCREKMQSQGKEHFSLPCIQSSNTSFL